jgi:hypothetical protein
MERKDAIQKEALMNAIANSSRSHDEILAFLKGNVRQE